MNHVKYEESLAWCHASLDNSFYFKDIEQVTINNAHGERLACQYCLRAIITSLLSVSQIAQLTSESHRGILEDCGVLS